MRQIPCVVFFTPFTPRGDPGLSHIVQIDTEVRDPQAVARACQRLGWPEPVLGTAELFSGAASGLLVKPPGWRYPVVVDTATGQTRFDHFEGVWGDPRLLHTFLQAYACENSPPSQCTSCYVPH